MSEPTDGAGGGSRAPSDPSSLVAAIACEWPANVDVLETTNAWYVAGAGNALTGLRCVSCDQPIEMTPVELHILISGYPCEQAPTHLPSLVVARHVTCPVPADAELAQLIVNAAGDCAG